MKSYKSVKKFTKLLKELETVEVMGVARLLGVKYVVQDEEGKIVEKDQNALLEEMINAYLQMEEEKKNFILKVMKYAGGK